MAKKQAVTNAGGSKPVGGKTTNAPANTPQNPAPGLGGRRGSISDKSVKR